MKTSKLMTVPTIREQRKINIRKEMLKTGAAGKSRKNTSKAQLGQMILAGFDAAINEIALDAQI